MKSRLSLALGADQLSLSLDVVPPSRGWQRRLVDTMTRCNRLPVASLLYVVLLAPRLALSKRLRLS